MKITNLEVYELKIPFSIGIKSSSADFLKQDGMDFCVIKIETDNGITGWGAAFSFNCRRAVSEVILNMVKPHLIGKNPLDVKNINFELQKVLLYNSEYQIQFQPVIHEHHHQLNL